MQKTVSTCNSHSTKNNNAVPEITLWAAKMKLLMDDALYPFTTSGEKTPSLETQYKNLLSKIKKGKVINTKTLCPFFEDGRRKYKITHTTKQTAIDTALYFFESAAFDHCLEYINRENQVNEIFSFIQKAVTMRKKYNIACMKYQMKKIGAKKKDLTESAQKYIWGSP